MLLLGFKTLFNILSYGLPTMIIASEDRPAVVKRGDHRRGVVCLGGDVRR